MTAISQLSQQHIPLSSPPLRSFLRLESVYHIDDNLSTCPILRLQYLTSPCLYVMIVSMYGEHLEITTEIVMKALGCSRQYVSELVKQGRLVPAGKRGKAYTFRFSELGKVLDTEQYLELIIRIDDLLTTNLPEVFEKRKPGWKIQGKDEAGK